MAAMTPEEYERFKQAEKEHFRKLKELKQAVHALERQKKVRSALEQMTRETSDALESQKELVERLAFETAMHEARLDVALDSTEAEAAGKVPDEAAAEALQRARAQALVEDLKRTIDEDAPERTANVDRVQGPTDHTARSDRSRGRDVNPTKGGQPEKTIGRM